MGWKGTLRSIQAQQRRAEREARRRQRELERERKEFEKAQELERAQYEVQVYENYIDLLLSVHKECGDAWDWEAIQSMEPPAEPQKASSHEDKARDRLTTYKPGTLDRLLKREESKRTQLTQEIEEAKTTDEREYQEALRQYETDQVDWQATQDLAERLLAGEGAAYLDAIRQVDPFSEISELGSSVGFRAVDRHTIDASLRVNGEDVIPDHSKSLLKSGKLSVKQMPKSRFYELYQDYVCGCMLRVARELFALLPVEMVIVNATAELLNTQTGHLEEQTILSAAVPRKTLDRLNFDLIDPSDSLKNFVHRMAFRKTKGFNAVEAVTVSELQES